MGAHDRKLSASLEDYLEAILNLADESGMRPEQGYRHALGVARSSVTGALQLLREQGAGPARALQLRHVDPAGPGGGPGSGPQA